MNGFRKSEATDTETGGSSKYARNTFAEENQVEVKQMR